MRNFIEKVKEIANKVIVWVKGNPITATIIAVSSIVVIGAITVLAVGFAPAGIATGSVAAGVMATTAPIAAGSAFAVL
jgi:preprotein translocase subunit SecE